MGRASRVALAAALLWLGACNEELPPNGSYFDEEIAPILLTNCAQQLTGCHRTTSFGTAAGNLDLTSYDALMRRRDVLPAFGPYPVGLLLMKTSNSREIQVATPNHADPATGLSSTMITTDIRHNAGFGLGLDAAGFAKIRRWIESGAQRHGTPAEPEPRDPGECINGIGVNDFEVNRFESTGVPDIPESYARFAADVQPVLRERCAGSNCHGNRLRTLYLSCGDTDEEIRWNYFISIWHLSDPGFRSELLHRPLSEAAGGDFHIGGDVFADAGDPGYQAILGWADDLLARDPSVVVEDFATDGFFYFVNRVQPVLVRKGCMFMNCHSPIAQNQDLQLQVGSQGNFGRAAQHRNHAALGLLALESEDPNQSRIIAKNLFPADQLEGGQGIFHRGGSLLEDLGPAGASVEMCDAYDVDGGDLNTIPAYCILARWQAIERQVGIDQGRIAPDPISGLVWVTRPLDVGSPMEFDTYRPGADLVYAPASIGADGRLTVGASSSLLPGCGLSVGTADVRSPAVSWDGTRIAFSARSSADTPLRLYWMNDDGSGCELVPGIAADVERENGILTHDFDPAFSPTGEMVFASTRGNVDRGAYDYQGPTRTPAAMAPNANLYVFAPFQEPPVHQLTFMLNQELSPTFTSVGRVVYMQEKRQPSFHQLALRQQNLDGGDFRPAFGARDHVGFNAATEGAAMLQRDLAFVASPLNSPDGAGMIAIANQSLGTDQDDRDPADRAYLHAMRIPAPGAFGGMTGVFRSPTAIPSRYLLVSCDPDATDPSAGRFDFDLCELDPATGAVRVVAGEAGVAEIEAVAIFSRYLLPAESVIPSDGEKLDRPVVVAGAPDAIVTFHDFPMHIGLMFDNRRGSRIVDTRIEGFDVLEALPPPTTATSFADVSGEVVMDDYGSVFVRRRRLGHVDLFEDASAVVRIPGGTPILWRPTDGSGTPLTFPAGSEFEGLPMIPREQDQYTPGERSRRSFPRHLFNHICGFCHAGMSGRELDVAVSPDAVTGASNSSIASHEDPVDFFIAPGDREAPE